MNNLEVIVSGIVEIAKTNPLLGWFVAVALLLILLAVVFLRHIPQIQILQSKLLAPWARKRKFNRLAKVATRADIEGHANKAIQRLKSELPSGWIDEMGVQWVRREKREDFLDDGEYIVRARPFEDQSKNFARVVYLVLRKRFFPHVKSLIPEAQREGAVLFTSHRIIKERNDKNTEAHFINHVLEPVFARKNRCVDYYNDFEALHKKGFFTSLALREMQAVSKHLQTSPERRRTAQEISNVLGHLKEFSAAINKNEESPWSREGVGGSYAIILVAHPGKIVWGGIDQYVNKAKQWASQGINRLYVIGAGAHTTFVEKVISSINAQTGYSLIDKFETERDYRKKRRGIGAYYEHKNYQNN